MKTQQQFKEDFAKQFEPKENRRQRRALKNIRKSTNRKGHGLVVARIGLTTFVKYRIVKQHLNGKTIIHSVAV